MRGFIDDAEALVVDIDSLKSQSAFVRGFIDDSQPGPRGRNGKGSLNPRSCAASSMTNDGSCPSASPGSQSQSAFVRGFIDDVPRRARMLDQRALSRLNPRSCAASSMT